MVAIPDPSPLLPDSLSWIGSYASVGENPLGFLGIPVLTVSNEL
jgi:hypothetical protein